MRASGVSLTHKESVIISTTSGDFSALTRQNAIASSIEVLSRVRDLGKKKRTIKHQHEWKKSQSHTAEVTSAPFLGSLTAEICRQPFLDELYCR